MGARSSEHPSSKERQRNPQLVENLGRVPRAGKEKKKTQPLMRVWKAKSVFWDLEYWSLLRSPHSLDIMHITKNVCESLFGTLLNMPEKTKDGPKVRNDLKFMGIRRELHPLVTTMMSRRKRRIWKRKTLLIASKKG